MNSRNSRTISPPSMLMEVMITYILYFILYSFYFSTELLDYFLNIIILSNSHSFIQDAYSYRSVIFNCEISLQDRHKGTGKFVHCGQNH